MSEEWMLAAIICAVPFVAFGILELFAIQKRRKIEALGRRSKSREGRC